MYVINILYENLRIILKIYIINEQIYIKIFNLNKVWSSVASPIKQKKIKYKQLEFCSLIPNNNCFFSEPNKLIRLLKL